MLSEHLQRFLKSSRHPTYLFETQSLSLLKANDTALEFYGYNDEEFGRLAFSDLFLPSDWLQFKPLYDDMVDLDRVNTVTRMGTWRHVTKSGHVRDIECNLCPLNSLNRQMVLIVLVRIGDGNEADPALPRNTWQGLARHLTAILEQERRDIGHDLHDDLGQNLTALKFRMKELDRWLSGRVPKGDRKTLSSKMEVLFKHAEDILNNVHEVVYRLTPPLLDDFGLRAAVEMYVKNFEEQTGVQCVLNASDAEINLALERRIVLFRILQEALTNIARHAGASRVRVGLACHQRDGRDELTLTIQDNGKGYLEGPKDRPGWGVLGMRQRARMLDGTWQLIGRPGRGTRIVVRLPILSDEEQRSPENSPRRRRDDLPRRRD